GSARSSQPFPALSVAGCLAVILLAGAPASAQTPPAQGQTPAPAAPAASGSVTVTPQPTHPQPGPNFGFEDVLAPEQGFPREDAHGERTRTIYRPAFVNGAVRTTRTSRTSGVRYGLSGWTVPRIP